MIVPQYAASLENPQNVIDYKNRLQHSFEEVTTSCQSEISNKKKAEHGHTSQKPIDAIKAKSQLNTMITATVANIPMTSDDSNL